MLPEWDLRAQHLAGLSPRKEEYNKEKQLRIKSVWGSSYFGFRLLVSPQTETPDPRLGVEGLRPEVHEGVLQHLIHHVRAWPSIC